MLLYRDTLSVGASHLSQHLRYLFKSILGTRTSTVLKAHLSSHSMLRSVVL